MAESKPQSEMILLIERQKEIGISIEQKRSTAVKYGVKRTKEAFNRILKEIESLWEEFLLNDNTLTEEASKDSTLLEQPYFKEGKKALIEQIRQKAIYFITSHFPDLVEITPETSNAGALTDEEEFKDTNADPEEVLSSYTNRALSEPSTSNVKTSNSKDVTNDALMKISEVLASQQSFQEQLHHQMNIMIDGNFGKPEGLKPPRVEIPSFGGQITLYQSFKDTFITVTNKSRMSRLEKLTLLKSKVTDIAEEYIAHISIADENYFRAWAILDERFDDPVAIISNQVDLILDMEEIPVGDVRAVEKTLNLIQGVANSFELLKISPEQPVMIRAIIRKLNSDASGELTRYIGNHKEFPSYKKLISFFIYYLSILRSKAKKEDADFKTSVLAESSDHAYLKTSVPAKSSDHTKNRKFHKSEVKSLTTLKSNSDYNCFICFEKHLAPSCDKLTQSKNPIELLRHYNICTKCAGHKFNRKRPCHKNVVCDICKGNHITILHSHKDTKTFLCKKMEDNIVILPTAVCQILGNNSSMEKRVLLDTCSQASYIEAHTSKLLNLPIYPCKLNIIGVGGDTTGSVQGVTKFKIQTRFPSPETIEVNAYVIKRTIKSLPSVPKNLSSLNSSIKHFADSYMGQPSHVPILLGADVTSQLFIEGTQSNEGLLFQNTKLGWIVSGPLSSNENHKQFVSTHVALCEFEHNFIPNEFLKNLDNELRQFWDIPVSKEDVELLEEEVCESIYCSKITRNDEGRYCVPIPWKENARKLGDSFNLALKVYLAYERRLAKDPIHQKMSNEFMTDYIRMGHMTLVPNEKRCVKDGSAYYIPYHGVLRKDSVTTKLRNVFNASAKTTTGVSLNATIYPGPKLQNKIFDIITRIRQFQFMYSSDITKMYRQILLLPEDREKIRILFRENPGLPLQEYFLNTVTYGMDCAPWQAIRTLRQAALDFSPSDKTKWIIENAFYMDDLFHGADTIADCHRQIKEITQTLDQAKLPLTKWLSNHRDVLLNVEKDKRLESYLDIHQENSTIKTLGIRYYPTADLFGYQVKEFSDIKFTKRGLLSISASLYDPIGWILPVVMKFRILLQKLWAEDVDWDDSISTHLKNKFDSCITSLPLIEKIKINRWMNCNSSSNVELVGFSDASGDGMAAVVYSRVKCGDKFIITLIAAKGKVTPLKTKRNLDTNLCTIPKMELEAVVLLCNLIKEIKSCLNNINPSVILYTDSQVTIAWIRKSEENENKFVRRRVSKIKKVVTPGMIHYVKSSENPADGASRGLSPEDFIKDQKVWTQGPSWLCDDVLPITPFDRATICNTTIHQQPEEEFIVSLENKFSSFDKLIGCVVTILLWTQIISSKKIPSNSIREKNSYKLLRSAECYSKAKTIVLKLHQKFYFAKEISLIQQSKLLPKHHWMRPLCPFIDEDGLLRVGGRLCRWNIEQNHKHPILISKGHLAKLIIKDIHLKNGHSANALSEGILKQNFWIVSSKKIIKGVIQACNTCLRFKAKTIQPSMSDLPIERINPGPIFENTAVDFCGPFSIKPSKLKFEKVIKAWVAVFVCMATKLVHLEICLELSVENFLAAFERFTSRRGTPSTMMSDNGTNFVAASKLLKHQLDLLIKSGSDSLAIQEIKWKFIPPGSPHFGGLHEACVKSFKYFLKRMERVENITYEEFLTLVCKIEGILNSRPLIPVSNDPNDEVALTPAHFAIQRSLKSPAPTLKTRSPIPISKKWTLLQEIQTDFWNRFLREYLSTQQRRYKWISPQRNLKIDDIVVIKDHVAHPLDWPLGKVVKCYPDDKGVVRKVDLKSKNNSIVHRAVNKLIPIPTEEEEKQHHSSKKQTRQRFMSPKSLLSMFAITMLCLSSVIAPTNTFLIEEMSPGVNIRVIEKNVSVKVLDVKFLLKTDINITEDFLQLDAEVKKFKYFCESLNDDHLSNVSYYCDERHSVLMEELKLTKSSILGTYTHYRSKRGLFTKIALGGMTRKVAPYAAMTAAYGWQEYENYKLRANLNKVEEKFNKVGFILLNLTETEHENVQVQLDSLVNQQNSLIIEGQINSYEEEIQVLISSMKTRHENFVNIHPFEELERFVAELNKPLPIVKIPNLQNPENIFFIHPVKKSLLNDLVHLEYFIPLVNLETFTKFIIISTSDSSNQTLLLDNDDRVQVIVANGNNSTYFYPQSGSEIFPTLYDTTNLQKKKTCSSMLLQGRIIEELCSKVLWKEKRSALKVTDDISILFIEHNTTIRCGDSTYNLSPSVYFVIHPECSHPGINPLELKSISASVQSSHHFDVLQSSFQPLEIKQTSPNQVPTNHQYEELKTLLETNITSSEDLPTIVIVLSSVCLFLILGLIWIIRCKYKSVNPDISKEKWTL